MEVLVMVVQLILGLAILVGIHEWGHMFAAKKFGMRVEKFFIFIPPALFSKKIGETEYGIGTIPLGGFVKISGMIDESMDREQMSQPAQPWEFRSKPAWQRLIVMLGGIIMNVILGVVIFIGLAMYIGEYYTPISKVKNGIYAGEIAREMGLQTGDHIVALDGMPVEEFDEVRSSDIFLGENHYYTVIRDGKELRIDVPNDLIGKLSNYEGKFFIEPQRRFSVGDVMPGSNAEKAGLMTGDSIVKMGRTEVRFFEQFTEDKAAFAGKVVPLKIIRNGETKILNAEVNKDGTLGFSASLEQLTEHRAYSFFGAIGAGITRAFTIITDTIKGFGKIGKGQVSASDAISGPLTIGTMFGGTFDPLHFFTMCGLLSMVLAFMNLLPIPALDGGHVVFLIYEMVAGRKPSQKFMEYAQIAGMIIIFALMAFAVSNDIYKVFIK